MDEMEKYKRKECYNLSQMKERGWTGAMIKALVKMDPILFRGMYLKCPQKCYPIEYIESLEETDEFKNMQNKSKERSEKMKIIAEIKRDENIEKYEKRIENIKIPIINEERLKKRTIYSKQQWYDYQAALRCDISDPIDEKSLPLHVLRRWEVNFIRHELTRYDDVLESIRGKIGTNEIFERLHYRVLEKIAEAYPYLKAECERQKNDVRFI
jgi:hypothetical protein